jgi:protease I
MRIAIIIAQNDFRDEELFDTKAVLEQNDVVVDVAALTMETARGKLGGTLRPDIVIDKISADDYNGVVFIGGPGAFAFINDGKIHQLAKQFAEKGKIVCAICIAPAILAAAGLLNGVKATVHDSGRSYLQKGGAEFVEEDVVADKNFITANGPSAASVFGEKIVQTLKNKQN